MREQQRDQHHQETQAKHAFSFPSPSKKEAESPQPAEQGITSGSHTPSLAAEDENKSDLIEPKMKQQTIFSDRKKSLVGSNVESNYGNRNNEETFFDYGSEIDRDIKSRKMYAAQILWLLTTLVFVAVLFSLYVFYKVGRISTRFLKDPYDMQIGDANLYLPADAEKKDAEGNRQPMTWVELGKREQEAFEMAKAKLKAVSS